jgi:head-tail adaptor
MTVSNNVGDFRHRVEIQESTITRGAQGTQVDTFATVITRWASIKENPNEQFIVDMRYVEGLIPTAKKNLDINGVEIKSNRLKHKARILNIDDVLDMRAFNQTVRGTRAQRAGVEAGRRAGKIIDLQILGVKEVRNNLKKLKLSVGRKVVNRALAQATARILKPAIDANIATVSPGKKGTGLLQDRETEVHKISRKPSHIGYHVRTASRAELNIQGDEPYYPALLEVGGNGLEGKHMLKRARDQKSGAVQTFLRRSIPRILDDEVKRIHAAGRTSLRSARQLSSFRKRGLIR